MRPSWTTTTCGVIAVMLLVTLPVSAQTGQHQAAPPDSAALSRDARLAGIRDYPLDVTEALIVAGKHPEQVDAIAEQIAGGKVARLETEGITAQLQEALTTLERWPETILIAADAPAELSALRQEWESDRNRLVERLEALRGGYAVEEARAATRWQGFLEQDSTLVTAYGQLLTRFCAAQREQDPEFPFVYVRDSAYYLAAPPDEALMAFAADRGVAGGLRQVLDGWWADHAPARRDARVFALDAPPMRDIADAELIVQWPAARRSAMWAASDEVAASVGMMPILLQPKSDQPAEARAVAAILEHARLWLPVEPVAADRPVVSGPIPEPAVVEPPPAVTAIEEPHAVIVDEPGTIMVEEPDVCADDAYWADRGYTTYRYGTSYNVYQPRYYCGVPDHDVVIYDFDDDDDCWSYRPAASVFLRFGYSRCYTPPRHHVHYRRYGHYVHSVTRRRVVHREVRRRYYGHYALHRGYGGGAYYREGVGRRHGVAREADAFGRSTSVYRGSRSIRGGSVRHRNTRMYSGMTSPSDRRGYVTRRPEPVSRGRWQTYQIDGGSSARGSYGLSAIQRRPTARRISPGLSATTRIPRRSLPVPTIGQNRTSRGRSTTILRGSRGRTSSGRSAVGHGRSSGSRGRSAMGQRRPTSVRRGWSSVGQRRGTERGGRVSRGGATLDRGRRGNVHSGRRPTSRSRGELRRGSSGSRSRGSLERRSRSGSRSRGSLERRSSAGSRGKSGVRRGSSSGSSRKSKASRRSGGSRRPRATGGNRRPTSQRRR